MRIPGRGHAGRRGGRPGDLVVSVKVEPHRLFRRDGDDLHLVVPVALHEAALGAKIDIPTFDGPVRLRVPPGTASGQRLRLRERGAPSLRTGGRGDLIVEVRLVLPALLDERSKELMREFGRINGEDVRQGLWGRRRREGLHMVTKRAGKAYYMISAVAQKYNIHPQTLRLYEREGLLKPSRTEGNTRLYSEEDLEQLETILSLTRDLGVNLAGVEIILNMRRKIERMQHEVNEFMAYVKHELARGLDDWEQRLNTALVKSSPTDLVRASAPPAAPGRPSSRPPRAPADRRRRARPPAKRREYHQGVSHPPRDEAAEAVTLQAYLQEIAKIPRLTPAEEHELAVRIQRDHDEEALKRLVEAQPPVRRLVREAVSPARRRLPRPDPRGQPRAARGGAPLRPVAQRQVHHLRRLVDPPGDHARAVRPAAPVRAADEALRRRPAASAAS